MHLICYAACPARNAKTIPPYAIIMLLDVSSKKVKEKKIEEKKTLRTLNE